MRHRVPAGFFQFSVFGSATVGGLGADLSITSTDSPDPVTLGGPLTYTIAIRGAKELVDGAGRRKKQPLGCAPAQSGFLRKRYR